MAPGFGEESTSAFMDDYKTLISTTDVELLKRASRNEKLLQRFFSMKLLWSSESVQIELVILKSCVNSPWSSDGISLFTILFLEGRCNYIDSIRYCMGLTCDDSDSPFDDASNVLIEPILRTGLVDHIVAAVHHMLIPKLAFLVFSNSR